MQLRRRADGHLPASSDNGAASKHDGSHSAMDNARTAPSPASSPSFSALTRRSKSWWHIFLTVVIGFALLATAVSGILLLKFDIHHADHLALPSELRPFRPLPIRVLNALNVAVVVSRCTAGRQRQLQHNSALYPPNQRRCFDLCFFFFLRARIVC